VGYCETIQDTLVYPQLWNKRPVKYEVWRCWCLRLVFQVISSYMYQETTRGLCAQINTTITVYGMRDSHCSSWNFSDLNDRRWRAINNTPNSGKKFCSKYRRLWNFVFPNRVGLYAAVLWRPSREYNGNVFIIVLYIKTENSTQHSLDVCVCVLIYLTFVQ
jgi:hypothetical protein